MASGLGISRTAPKVRTPFHDKLNTLQTSCRRRVPSWTVSLVCRMPHLMTRGHLHAVHSAIPCSACYHLFWHSVPVDVSKGWPVSSYTSLSLPPVTSSSPISLQGDVPTLQGHTVPVFLSLPSSAWSDGPCTLVNPFIQCVIFPVTVFRFMGQGHLIWAWAL